PANLGFRGVFDPNLQVQPGQEIRKTHRLRLKLFAASIFEIDGGAFAVFIGDLEVVKDPNVREKTRDRWQILGKLQRDHARTIGLDFGALNRVVVDENEAVEAEVEFGGERFEVLRFGGPIEATSSEIFALERHVVATKDFLDIVRIVLAAETKEQAGVQLGAHELLQRAAR